jgi:hypothetical protein
MPPYPPSSACTPTAVMIRSGRTPVTPILIASARSRVFDEIRIR